MAKKLNDDLLGHLDRIYGKLEEQKQEQVFTNAAIKRIETDVNTLKQDVGVLKQDVGVLKQDVGVLKQDVGEIKSDIRRVEEKLDAHIKLPAHV
jgi:chromosome segregation ATPase